MQTRLSGMTAVVMGLVLASASAGCGDSVVADPHNPGGFITPMPTAGSSSVEPTASASAATPTDLRGVRPQKLDETVLASLDDYITDAMDRYEVPGVAVAVVQDGEIVHLNAFGVREVGKSDPVTPDTLMKIGSVTKSMTTLMIASLVDDGRLTWETPATSILPWFETSDPALTPQITVRDLVSNSTGIARRDIEMIFTASDLDAEGVVRSLKSFEFEPDSEFRKTYGYSNQMVATGGYVAAQTADGASGDLYGDYEREMDRRVFGPIGMESSTFSLDEVLADRDHATPHAFNLDYSHAVVPVSEEEMLTPFAPAGAAWSNAREMGRYLVMELNKGVSPDGNRVVSETNLGKTWTPQVSVTPGRSYGLGWFITDYKGQQRIGHGGDTIGFGSTVDFLPDAGIGIVVLTNNGGMSTFGAGVAARLYELAFSQPFDVDPKVAEYFQLQKQGYLDAFSLVAPNIHPSDVAPYVGNYLNPALGDIRIAFRGGRLSVDARDFRSELGSIGEQTFLLLNPPIPATAITLGRDDRGRPTLTFTTNNPDQPGSWQFVRK